MEGIVHPISGSKYEDKEERIWSKHGDYMVGGYTQSELDRMKELRERDEQATIKHKAKVEKFFNWFKGTKSEKEGGENKSLGITDMKSKAHENINNLILVDTLNRMAHSSDMFGNQALYQAETQGGEKRHILRNFGGGTDKQDLELIDHLLREQIKAEPAFSDTLATEELPGVRKTMAQAGHPFKNILRMIMGR